jgi:hypothetical protein
MNLVELKKMKISDLTDMAKTFEIEGATGMPKQELVFSLLRPSRSSFSPSFKPTPNKMALFTEKVSWKSCRMGLASSGRQIPITCRALMTSTYLPLR